MATDGRGARGSAVPALASPLVAPRGRNVGGGFRIDRSATDLRAFSFDHSLGADRCLPHLRGMKKLQDLQMTTGCTDALLENLAGLTALKRLVLKGIS